MLYKLLQRIDKKVSRVYIHPRSLILLFCSVCKSPSSLCLCLSAFLLFLSSFFFYKLFRPQHDFVSLHSPLLFFFPATCPLLSSLSSVRCSAAFLGKILVSLPSSLQAPSSSSSPPPGQSFRKKTPQNQSFLSSSSSPSASLQQTSKGPEKSTASSQRGHSVSLHSLVSCQRLSPSTFVLRLLQQPTPSSSTPSVASQFTAIESALERHASVYGYASRVQKSSDTNNSL